MKDLLEKYGTTENIITYLKTGETQMTQCQNTTCCQDDDVYSVEVDGIEIRGSREKVLTYLSDNNLINTDNFYYSETLNKRGQSPYVEIAKMPEPFLRNALAARLRDLVTQMVQNDLQDIDMLAYDLRLMLNDDFLAERRGISVREDELTTIVRSLLREAQGR